MLKAFPLFLSFILIATMCMAQDDSTKTKIATPMPTDPGTVWVEGTVNSISTKELMMCNQKVSYSAEILVKSFNNPGSGIVNLPTIGKSMLVQITSDSGLEVGQTIQIKLIEKPCFGVSSSLYKSLIIKALTD